MSFTNPSAAARESPRGTLQLVNPEYGFGRVRLIDTTKHGYLYLGAAVASRPFPFVLPSLRRSRLIRALRPILRSLSAVPGVERVSAFRAIVMPPTARFSRYLQATPSVAVANFDVMVLVEAESPGRVRQLQQSDPFGEVLDVLRRASSRVWTMPARNVRRIADVDTRTPGGLFLFNHFAAADDETMLELWDYLAAWYARKTGLRNSVALAPIDRSRSDYAIVNWARWDIHPFRHFWHQLADRGFWKFVTANLDANHAASMPVYCRRLFVE